METAFQTGPGFYAAQTRETDKSLPPNKLRIYCARIEAYDMDTKDGNEPALDTSFELLVAKAEDDPRIAHALLQLHSSLAGNLGELKRMAAR